MSVDQLEPVTCTELKQRWGKPEMQRRARGLFTGTHLDKMCCFQQKDVMKEPQIPVEGIGVKVQCKRDFTISGNDY